MLIEPIESSEKHTVDRGASKNCSWGKFVSLVSLATTATETKHANADIHNKNTCNSMFACYARLHSFEWFASRFSFALPWYLLTPHPPHFFSGEPVELWHPHKSTHSVWHRALWCDAPWPALIRGGESKWRGSKIDRSKDSLSELKANRH